MNLRRTSKYLNSCPIPSLRQNLDKTQNLDKQINSFHIPKEFPKNSQRIQIEFRQNTQRLGRKFPNQNPPDVYPQTIPRRFQKIPREFPKKSLQNSKNILTRICVLPVCFLLCATDCSQVLVKGSTQEAHIIAYQHRIGNSHQTGNFFRKHTCVLPVCYLL